MLNFQTSNTSTFLAKIDKSFNQEGRHLLKPFHIKFLF